MQPNIHWIYNSFVEEKCFGRVACASTAPVDKCLYIHGGTFLTKGGKRIKLIDDMWKIQVRNIADVCITLVPQHGVKPSARFRHHLCNLRGKLYLFGGKTEISDDISLKGMYKFSTRSYKWREFVEKGEAPDALGNSSTVIGEQIFTFGGTARGVANNNMHCFDRSTKVWQLLSASGKVPSPRTDHAVTEIGNDILLFGGSGGPDIFYSDMYNFNTDTLQWTRLDGTGIVPIPRAGHSLVAHHKKDIYIIGGYNDQLFPDGGPILEDLCKFSVSRKRWKTCEALNDAPEPTYQHASWIMHNHLYILGGACLDGGVTTVRVAKIINPSQREEYAKEMTERDDFTFAPSQSDFSHSLPLHQTGRSY